jgi:hypothetical protein
VGLGGAEAAVVFPLVFAWLACPGSDSGAEKPAATKEKKVNKIQFSMIGEFISKTDF